MLLASACGGAQTAGTTPATHEDEAPEAALLLRHLDRLDAAANDPEAQASQLDALEGLSLRSPRVALVHRDCVALYGALIEAERFTREADRAMTELEAQPEENPELQAEVAEALQASNDALARANRVEAACGEAREALEADYGQAGEQTRPASR